MHAKYDISLSLSPGSNIISRDVVVFFFFFFALDRTTKSSTVPNFIKDTNMELSLLRSFIVDACVVDLDSKICLCARIQHLSRQRLGTKSSMGQPRTEVRLNMQSPSLDHRIFSETSYWCKDLHFTFKAAQPGFEHYTISNSGSDCFDLVSSLQLKFNRKRKYCICSLLEFQSKFTMQETSLITLNSQ